MHRFDAQTDADSPDLEVETRAPDARLLKRWGPWLRHLIPSEELVRTASQGTRGADFEWGPSRPDAWLLMALACEEELRSGLARVGLEGADRILDAGCGPGLIAGLLAEASGGLAVGVDRQTEMLEFARTLPPPARGEARYEEGDLDERLPFAAGMFDVTFIGDLWRSAPYLEAMRVTRPGGRLVLKMTNVMPDMTYVWDVGLDLRLQQAVVTGARRLASEGRSRSESVAELHTAFRSLAAWRSVHTFTVLIERLWPVPTVFEEAERQTFARTVGPLIRDVVDDDEWARVAALWDPASPDYVFRRTDGHFVRAMTFLVGQLPD